MNKHFQDYFWKEGLPFGINPHDTATIPGGLTTYKIVSDPYHKRNSIEKYSGGHFVEIIYDSQQFDFRHLKPALQKAWEKTTVSEDSQKAVCHIRDHDDRLILIEHHHFENGRCRSCTISSPAGTLLSRHQLHYKALGDPYDGVALYDANNHPVLIKKYTLDPHTQEFDTLLSEQWNFGK